MCKWPEQVQSRLQAQECSHGISPDSLLKVPMVLCNLAMLSFKFMKDPQGLKNKMTKLSSV